MLRCISVGDDTKWVIGAVVGVSMFLIMTNCSNAEPRLAREPVRTTASSGAPVASLATSEGERREQVCLAAGRYVLVATVAKPTSYWLGEEVPERELGPLPAVSAALTRDDGENDGTDSPVAAVMRMRGEPERVTSSPVDLARGCYLLVVALPERPGRIRRGDHRIPMARPTWFAVARIYRANASRISRRRARAVQGLDRHASGHVCRRSWRPRPRHPRLEPRESLLTDLAFLGFA